MLQPFERLLPMYVSRLEALNKTFMVTQHYASAEPAPDAPGAVPLIVSVYDDPGLAKTHWNAVKEDPLAAIIRLDLPAHKQKLYDMLSGDTYVLYWAVVKDAAALEKKINAQFKDHVRRYIDQKTNWRVARSTTLRVSIQLIFGELYMNLRHGSQLIRIKMAEIAAM